LIGYGLGLN